MMLRSGDEEAANTQTTAPQSASATLKTEPFSPPEQQQQQSYAVDNNVKVERSTDPRKQAAPVGETHDQDPDREFARNGGAQWEGGTHEDTQVRDNRPNPNKHEDG